MGDADGFAPVIGTEGFDVFHLGELEGLDYGLAEIGEGRGGFGFHLTLGDGGEEASESGAEVAGGHEAAGKVIGDILAGFFAREDLRVLASVERAEVRMVCAGSTALAAVGEGERTQRGTNVGAIGGHRSLQKEDLILGFWGSLAEARRGSEQGKSTRAVIGVSITFCGGSVSRARASRSNAA